VANPLARPGLGSPPGGAPLPTRAPGASLEPPAPAPSPAPGGQAPEPPPASPAEGVAYLKAKVNLVWRAGELSDRGRGQLLDRVHRMEDALSRQRSKNGNQLRTQVRKETSAMLQEMADLRARGEFTAQGEQILDDAIDRLTSTL
jgi:hypothetical protein